MTEIIIAILGIAILLYILLGGADFGAGIVELITGKKGIETISKAIAPVWEANHIWIILAVVILFNGFPLVYTSLTTYLHIPLLLVLIGIIIRGTTFTFRYYNSEKDMAYPYYSLLFRLSSLLTPFFLGIILGAIMLKKIPVLPDGDFYSIFIAPWLNLFSVTTGIFLTLLFGWIASVYLLGETDAGSYRLFAQTALILFILLIISGLMVFLAAEYYGLHLIRNFLHSIVSIICIISATVIIPIMWRNIRRRNIIRTRLLAGFQTACILTGWFGVQFPVMVFRANGDHLTVWNSSAPEKTMYYLFLALLVGIIIILPAFAYLFKVFKFNHQNN